MGYSQAVEEIMGIEVPERALYLRTIWAELSRVHSHIFWLGVAADAFGFESFFMQSLRLRESVLDIFEETTGARVILGVCKVGGVRRDMEDETLKGIVNRLDAMRGDLEEISNVFIDDYSIKHRLSGVGYISREDAYALGCVGPMARASGLAMDMRTLGYAAYKYLDVEPMVESAGDCYARCVVEIALRLSKELSAIIARPQIREQIDRQGFALAASTPDELGAFIKRQLDAWAVGFREAGMQPE